MFHADNKNLEILSMIGARVYRNIFFKSRKFVGKEILEKAPSCMVELANIGCIYL